MAPVEEYRCADYDMDPDFDRTTSWPDGLQEMDRFEPYLLRPVRRISTDADIQRYKNLFSIAQRNQGLSWKQYLRILQADLHQFDTRDLEIKALQKHSTSSWNSKKLHPTASKHEFFKEPESRFEIAKRNALVKKQAVGDIDSVSSMEYDSTFSKEFSRRLASPMESGISHYITAPGSEFSLPAYQVTKKSSFDKTKCIRDTDSVSSMEYDSTFSKEFSRRLASPQESGISHYVSASGSEFSLSSYQVTKKSSFEKSIGDTESVSSVTTCITMNSISLEADSSMNSNASVSPPKNLFKKFLSGIRRFAVKTKKTVVNPAEQCPNCGNYAGDVKTHEERSQSVLSVFELKRPPTPSVLNYNNNLERAMSKTSLTSIGSGECTVRPQLTKKMTSTYKKKEKIKRMAPFVE